MKTVAKVTQTFDFDASGWVMSDQIRRLVNKSDVKFQQITFSPIGDLYGLDVQGRVWVFDLVIKEWIEIDGPQRAETKQPMREVQE
jgi:hypothetical protein